MGIWELFRKYPHWCFFIIASAFLLGAVLNAKSSEGTKNYREIEAEICNLEEVQVVRHRRFVTRYNYDVVWYLDGVKYIRHMQEEIDRVSEGERTIWVSMNNQKLSLHSPEEIEKQSIQELLIALAAGIAGIVTLIIRRKDRQKNHGKA